MQVISLSLQNFLEGGKKEKKKKVKKSTKVF